MDTNKCWIAKGEKQELQSPPDGYLKSCTAEMLRCSPVANFSNEVSFLHWSAFFLLNMIDREISTCEVIFSSILFTAARKSITVHG